MSVVRFHLARYPRLGMAEKSKSWLSFDWVPDVVNAFGGSWLAILALVVIVTGGVLAISAKPFFRYLEIRHKENLKHQRFDKNLDAKLRRRALKTRSKSGRAPATPPKTGSSPQEERS